jgi:peptidoglycan/LPS O-acetylase OafA/YrhL
MAFIVEQSKKKANGEPARLGYINSLRGGAILLVLMLHVSTNIGISKELSFITSVGQMGVQLFFILSAFTLCSSFDNRAGEQYPVRSFYIRRFFRIAPLYYTGIVLYFFYSCLENYFSKMPFLPVQYSLKNISANIFFVHGLYAPANNNVVPGGWSVGTEMLFYLMFPLLFFLYRKLLKAAWLLFLVPIITVIIVQYCSVAFSQFTPQSLGNNSFYYYSIFNQLPVFLTGLSVYFLGKHKFSSLPHLHSVVIFLFIFFLIAACYSFHLAFLTTVTPFLFAVAFGFLLPVFNKYSSLNSKWLKRIGELSFSIYVVHFLFAFGLSGWLATQLKNT